jgi:DHA1 family bicyclomycin/chloramphenicol resistance-like MFS transporter
LILLAEFLWKDSFVLKPDTLALTILLACLTGLGPLSTDLYLPSLPAIARAFQSDAATVQLTLSAYLIGYAAGQIVHGPLSDRLGRRPVLIAGLVGFIAASILCAVSGSILMMVVARFIQGLAASGPIVLARSIARDLYEGPRAARELARMGAIMGIIPAIAPVLGGAMSVLFGWPSGFEMQAGLGLVLAATVLWGLPETVSRKLTTPFSLLELARDFRRLLDHGGYRLHISMQAATYAGLFAFISGSSFVLQGLYHMSEVGYGLAFASCACSFVAGSILTQRLVTRIGMERAVGIGTLFMATGGVLAALGQILHSGWPQELIVPAMLFMAGVGVSMPLTQAAALMPFPHMAGTASSLLGFVQMSFAAIIGTLVGHFLSFGAWSVVVAMALLGLATYGLHRQLNRWRQTTA